MIIVQRCSDLELQTWYFCVDLPEQQPRLDLWIRDTRPDRRHKFRNADSWDSSYDGSAPDVPPDVLDEARRRLDSALKEEL